MSGAGINTPQIGIRLATTGQREDWKRHSQLQQKHVQTQPATAELKRTHEGSVSNGSRRADLVTPATFVIATRLSWSQR